MLGAQQYKESSVTFHSKFSGNYFGLCMGMGQTTADCSTGMLSKVLNTLCKSSQWEPLNSDELARG
jgi:hypothetical protein